MLVISPERQGKPLRRELEQLDAVLIAAPSIEAVSDEMKAGLRAVVLHTEAPDTFCGQVVDEIGRPQRVPVFALVPYDVSGARSRRLYRAGVAAVIEWPRERQLLPRLLVEMAELGWKKTRSRRSDRSLLDAIRARIRWCRAPRPSRVTARQGVVWVEGEVESLDDRDELLSVIADTPGVQGLIAENLRVADSHREDQAIRRDLRGRLDRSPDVDGLTVALSVDEGRVTLAGVVAEQRQLERAERLARQVEGVREVLNLLTVSRPQVQRDAPVARRLRKSLAGLFPEHRIQVSVFDGNAVLQGRLPSLGDRKRVVDIVRRDAGMHRVVDKTSALAF